MTLKLSNAAVDAEGDAFAALLNGGSFKIYTGAQPVSADDVATGTLLGTVTLNNPAFASSANGVCTLDVPVSAAAVAAGTAGWGRFLTSGDGSIMDVSITEAGSGGEAIIDTATVAVDDPLKITSCVYTIPKS